MLRVLTARYPWLFDMVPIALPYRLVLRRNCTSLRDTIVIDGFVFLIVIVLVLFALFNIVTVFEEWPSKVGLTSYALSFGLSSRSC